MLDGTWRFEATDDRGMAARGVVLLRDGRMSGAGDLAGLTGRYQCQDDLVLGTLDLVLQAADAGGVAMARRVRLQIQGCVSANLLTASGVDIADPDCRVALRLEHRSLWAPDAEMVPGVSEAAVNGPPEPRRFAAVMRLGEEVGRTLATPQAGGLLSGDDRDGPLALPKARLPLAIRAGAAMRESAAQHTGHQAVRRLRMVAVRAAPMPEPDEASASAAPHDPGDADRWP